MKQWEYKVIYLNTLLKSLEKTLKNAGKQGWELCSADSYSTGATLIFKRELPQEIFI